MKLFRLFIFLVPFLFFQKPIHAQARMNADSLWKAFNNTSLPDTSRLTAIHELAWQQVFSNFDSAIVLAKMELSYAEKTNNKKYQAGADNSIGIAYINMGDYKNALVYNQRSYDIRKEMHEKKGMAAALNNIGIVYNYEGDVATAIDYWQRSLKLKLEIGDMAGVAASYSNLGLIYGKQKMDDKALDFFMTSLHIRDSLKDSRALEDSYSKLSAFYGDRKNFVKSREYTLKAIEIGIQLHHKVELGNNYENLGLTFDKMDEPDSAEKYFNIALQYRTEAKDEDGIADCYGDLGSLLLSRGQVEKAIDFLTKCRTMSIQQGDAELEGLACHELADALEKKGDFKNALIDLKRSDFIKDSLNTLEKSKSISQKILQYEFERRALADSLHDVKENAVKDLKRKEEVHQQKIYAVAGVIGFLLMVMIAFILLRGYRQKQKNNEALETKNRIITEQKHEVENQKLLLEEKNKEVLDSINYAQRLQQAILPSEKTWLDFFPDSFIFYKPKDIVAGDFYWVENSADKILFAAADCTGHGVPGALVSVVCSNALNRAVKEFGLTDPGKILDKVTELVLETFSESENEVNDGMDISLCCLDKKTNKVLWAGANNPLWVIFPDENRITELKPDKQPIGQFDHRKPFTTQSIQLKPGSFLYLFTDGYADQFGGPQGKKFKYKHFGETILAINKLKMSEQNRILEKTFMDWRTWPTAQGDAKNLDQVDDVCVIGIRMV